MNVAFVSQVEPQNVTKALQDENSYLAMQEELNHFKRKNVWKFQVIRTKWVFRNKIDDFRTIVKKKGKTSC